MIRKNERTTKLELENIRRRVLHKEKDTKANNNGNTSEQFYQDEENIHKTEATHADTEDGLMDVYLLNGRGR